jgi:sialate O-acetylesterase
MKLRLTALLCGLAVTLSAGIASADVKLPAIFTSHMVLQQKLANPVWGTAAPGEEVTVSIGDQKLTTKAGDDGKWRVKLAPMDANAKPQTLTVQGKNEVKIEDVLVGEVWICSGQSNMQWEVAQSTNAELEIATAKYPQIRFISVPQVGTQEPQADFKGAWEVCSPATIGKCSAVGYFFGRQLHQQLEVPIGLIDDAWGGSACEAWINRETLAKDGRFGELLAAWEGFEKNFDKAKADADHAAALEKWKADAAAAKEAGKQPPRAPGHPGAKLTGNARPGNIYNGVLLPTIGYGIKGVIWYQGESNAGRAYQYRDLFPLMIKTWRDEWKQGDFSFYYVQLADYLQVKDQPGDSNWAELREAQTLTMDKLPNVGEAVIIDIGEADDIHPRNKVDVGNRLARWALAKDYGLKVSYQSPRFKSMETAGGGKVTVTFDHVGSGLTTIESKDVKGFAVAGEDKVWHWATAEIDPKANNKVIVSCKQVEKPVAVRYGWADNPICNLFSKEDLPATPFRSDDWPGLTIDVKKPF